MGARKSSTDYSKTDIIVILLFPVIATLLTVIFNTNFLVSILLFFTFPGIYLSARRPYLIKKSLVFSVAITFPLLLVFTYLIQINNIWQIDNVYNIKLLGMTNIEDIFWIISGAYFTVILYEYFIDKGNKRDAISTNIKYLVIIMTTLTIIILPIMYINHELLYIRYFYLKFGLVLFLLPLTVFLAFFPNLLKKYLLISLYFFVLFMLYEFSALYTKQWWFFETNTLGTIDIFGLRFAYEEFFFWFVITTPTALAYYEFFVDDRK